MPDFLLKIKYEPERRFCSLFSQKTYQLELQKCHYFNFYQKTNDQKQHLAVKKLKERSLLKSDLSGWPKTIASCSFRPIETMKTLSCV